MRALVSEKNAHAIAVLLQYICYVWAFFAAAVMLLILLGRVQLNMTTPTGHYDNALLVEQDHSAASRSLYTPISNQPVFLIIHNADGAVSFATWLGIVLIGAVRVLPLGYCALRFSAFFKNIAANKVFITHNANILLGGGIVLLASALAAPVINGLLFPLLIRLLTSDQLIIPVSVNEGPLFFGAALLIMAYVFHYGIYLQDEADHTL